MLRPAIIAHLSMFGAFGWFLMQVRELKWLYDDMGANLPWSTAILMRIDSVFQDIGLPVWICALAGLGLDFGVWKLLLRKGMPRAAETWLWLVAAAIVPITVFLQQVLLLPMILLIRAME